MTIALWLLPESDFASWCALVGTLEVDDSAGCRTLLAAVQADQERMENEVVRVRLTVAEMQAELAARGWEHTPDNRTAIVALLYNRAWTSPPAIFWKWDQPSRSNLGRSGV